MLQNINFNFRLASPFYKKYLDFIGAYERRTPAKALNGLIAKYVYEVLDAMASKKAQDALVTEFDIPVDSIRWLRGSNSANWQALAANIGMEKTLAYQEKFLPLWDEYINKIDEAEGLHFFELERRAELNMPDEE